MENFGSQVKMAELAKTLRKATNIAQGAFGFFPAMEKQIHDDLHQGRFDGGFVDLCKLAEHLLPANIGSNQFHHELEKFLIVNFTDTNIQDIVNLVKGLSTYRIKEKELNHLIYNTLIKHIDNFSIKQLEILLWSESRVQANEGSEEIETVDEDDVKLREEYLGLLIDKIRLKSPSMRPRGVAFAIEALANLNYQDKDVFGRLEKVVLAKLDEFIPHYAVKILAAYSKVG